MFLEILLLFGSNILQKNLLNQTCKNLKDGCQKKYDEKDDDDGDDDYEQQFEQEWREWSEGGEG